jgi:hypothetical protein
MTLIRCVSTTFLGFKTLFNQFDFLRYTHRPIKCFINIDIV